MQFHMYSTSQTYFSPDFLSFLNIDFRNSLANSQIDIDFFSFRILSSKENRIAGRDAIED